MAGFLKPRYAPTNVNGTEIKNHSMHKATRVPNGMAAEDSFIHRTKFNKKKIAKIIPGNKNEVSMTLVFHCSPPNILYILEATKPAGVPKKTYRISIAVIKPPRVAGDKKPKHAKNKVMTTMSTI